MDPYAILGIEPTEDWNKIKHAYKKMANATHPDKMDGSAKYFMMVQEAYKDLEKIYNYKSRSKVREDPSDFLSKSQKAPCEVKNFNSYFEKNQIKEIDPFSQGYRKYMTKSNVREEVDQLKKNKVKRKQKQIVVYHEPIAAQEKKAWLDQVGLLGIDKIDDFTCSQGVDYMRAYEEPEKIKEKQNIVSSIDELEYLRANMDIRLTKEDKKRMAMIEKEKQELERRRRQIFKTNNRSIEEQYNSIHNLLR